MDQPTPPDPGWHPDAADPTHERWLDGSDRSPVTQDEDDENPSAEGALPVPGYRQDQVPVPSPRPATPGAGPNAGPGPSPGPSPGPGPNPYRLPVNPYAAPPPDRYSSGEGRGTPPEQGTDGQQPNPPQTPPASHVNRLVKQPVAGPTTPDGVPLALLGLRLAARVLDMLITTVLTATAGAYYLAQMVQMIEPEWADFLAHKPGADLTVVIEDPAFLALMLRYGFVGLLVGGVYSVVFTHLLGGTLGKLMVGIRVRSWDEPGRPTWGQALARWLTREVIAEIRLAGIGFVYWTVDSVWLLWDPRRQCLHDKLPGTVVVQHR